MRWLEALAMTTLGLGIYATYVVWVLRLRRNCQCAYCAEEA